MTDKIKNTVSTVLVCAFLAVFSVLCIVNLVSPNDYSDIEKRPLAQFPADVTFEQLVNNKDYTDPITGEEKESPIKQFENATVDQFPLREFFRNIKVNFVFNVLGIKENNGYAEEDGSIAQIETVFVEENVDHQLGRLEYIYNKYLTENENVYFCLIPDKTYFFGKDYGYPTRDYEWLKDKIAEKLPELIRIEIFDKLSLDDYYKNDWHWAQEDLLEVQAAIAESLGITVSGEYIENVLEGFRGGYTDMSALYPKEEELIYLTNEILDNCTVYDYETGKTGWLYNFDLYESKVQYDFFLSGSKSLLRIDNPNAETERELVVFRDSFGANLIPLLSEGYSSIFVVDIRYIMPDVVGNLIGGYEGRDVMFLYSATVLGLQKDFK